MSFDPSTNATQLAALQARCDYGQFTLSIVATKTIDGPHPLQSFFGPATSGSVVAISWTGSYRGVNYANLRPQPYPQPALFVDSVNQAVGEAAVLAAANNFLDELDLQASGFGANPNPYAVSPYAGANNGPGTPNAG